MHRKKWIKTWRQNSKLSPKHHRAISLYKVGWKRQWQLNLLREAFFFQHHHPYSCCEGEMWIPGVFIDITLHHFWVMKYFKLWKMISPPAEVNKINCDLCCCINIVQIFCVCAHEGGCMCQQNAPARCPPHMHPSVMSHGSTLTHEMTSTSYPPPPAGLPCVHLKDRWLSGGVRWLVPSDQLSLISCPSLRSPSVLLHPHSPATKGCDSCGHTDHRLRFKNKSCQAGGCVPPRQRRAQTHNLPTVICAYNNGRSRGLSLQFIVHPEHC